MARIKKVTLFPIRVPIPFERVNCPEFQHEPLNRGPSGGFDGPWFGDVPIHAIKVESGGGSPGWGDASRTIKTTDLAVWAKRLLGLTPAEVDPRRDLWEGLTVPRGLHTAALDWRARCEGVPLHKLFGERVREGIAIADWSGFRTPRGAAKCAVEAKARGITTLKLKAGLETDSAGIAAAVRQACGDGFVVVIDPNGRWETHEATLAFARAIMAVNPAVELEDPVYSKDKVMADVRRETGIKMIRTASGVSQIAAIQAVGCADGLNLVGHWPGLLPASALAHKLGLPYWTGSSVDTGLADLAVIHLGVTQPGFTLPCEIAGHQVREHDLLATRIDCRNGFAYPPAGPGLGIDVDEAAIAKYLVAEPVVVE